MTDEARRPIRSPLELQEAIAEANRRHPDDPQAAADYLLTNYQLDAAIALSLAMQGQRELGRVN